MRYYISLLSVLLLFGFSCEKELVGNCEADMVFTKVAIANTSSAATGIKFEAEAYGANLCYSFSRFVIEKTADKTYDIRIKAAIPCGQPVCVQALYQTTQIGMIQNVTAGVYTLKFYNTDGLFTTFTVTII